MSETGTIGVVVPFDVVRIHSGSAQRVKADLLALGKGGFAVEVLCPSATRERHPYAGEPGNPLSGVTLLSYPNIQKLTFLPEKVRLLIDSYSQTVNPFLRSTLRRRCVHYSVVLAHFPMSFVAAHRAIGERRPIIYVAHDFEYGLIRQATSNPVIRAFIHRTEGYACRRASKILCVSERDMKDLQGAYDVPPTKLAVLPNTVDVDFLSQTHTLYDRVVERRKLGFAPESFLLLFHGRMDYRPNVDALRFLLNRLVPALREARDSVQLMIVGAKIPGWCYDRADENVSLHPDVPDMRRFLSVADAVIVPLAIGGGTRLKILESFAATVPVISTAKGAEGIDCENGKHILIARRDADDLITNIKVVAESESLRKRLVSNAYQLVVEKYGIRTASRCLREAIAEAQGETGQTRNVAE